MGQEVGKGPVRARGFSVPAEKDILGDIGFPQENVPGGGSVGQPARSRGLVGKELEPPAMVANERVLVGVAGIKWRSFQPPLDVLRDINQARRDGLVAIEGDVLRRKLIGEKRLGKTKEEVSGSQGNDSHTQEFYFTRKTFHPSLQGTPW